MRRCCLRFAASVTPVPAVERPLRKDAERNRRRILAAAQVVFAEQGLGASLDDVARRAEVGIGTVYRRFPDKEHLIAALFEERIDAVVAAAGEAALAADPWAALVGFLERVLAAQAVDRGLKQLLISSGSRAQVHDARERILPHVRTLVARAQAAGVMREDVTAEDLPLLQLMVGAVMDSAGAEQPELWRRYLALFLDALRRDRTAPAPLPVGPPDEARVEATLRAWRPPGR
jgi:AcrR family transcriptional regulator